MPKSNKNQKVTREEFQRAIYALSVDVGTPVNAAIVAVAARRMRDCYRTHNVTEGISRDHEIRNVIGWAGDKAAYGNKGALLDALNGVRTKQAERYIRQRPTVYSLDQRLAIYRRVKARNLFLAAGFRACESAWVREAQGMQVYVQMEEGTPECRANAREVGYVSVERQRMWSRNGKWSAVTPEYTLRLPFDWSSRVAPHAHDFGPRTFVVNVSDDGKFLVARQSRGFDILTKWETPKGLLCQGKRVGSV